MNCEEKFYKLSKIVEECDDVELLDDLANTHVAQCSAENIMLWCLYLDNFRLDDYISSSLASEYHTKRVSG